MEIIPTTKGKNKLCYDGFMYTVQVKKKNISWRCVKKNEFWKGNLTTDINMQNPVPKNPHNHLYYTKSVSVTKYLSNLKEKAKNQTKTPQKLFAEATEELICKEKTLLRSAESIKRHVIMIRSQNFPNSPKTIRELVINEEWTKTKNEDGERFLLHVFATKQSLKRISDSSVWFMDGNYT